MDRLRLSSAETYWFFVADRLADYCCNDNHSRNYWGSNVQTLAVSHSPCTYYFSRWAVCPAVSRYQMLCNMSWFRYSEHLRQGACHPSGLAPLELSKYIVTHHASELCFRGPCLLAKKFRVPAFLDTGLSCIKKTPKFVSDIGTILNLSILEIRIIVFTTSIGTKTSRANVPTCSMSQSLCNFFWAVIRLPTCPYVIHCHANFVVSGVVNIDWKVPVIRANGLYIESKKTCRTYWLWIVCREALFPNTKF
jgi:hypothetical protein